MKHYISICKQVVAQNRKRLPGDRLPPVRYSRGKHGRPEHYNVVQIPDKARNVMVIYAPEAPLPWGARAWIEFEL